MSLELSDLHVYKIARELSTDCWKIYIALDWQNKKVIGDQLIRSIDSIGANIAEGYGRFHYLDRIKFLYNARGSLLEAKHWLELIEERNLNTNKELVSNINRNLDELKPQLNSFISTIYKNRNK